MAAMSVTQTQFVEIFRSANKNKLKAGPSLLFRPFHLFVLALPMPAAYGSTTPTNASNLFLISLARTSHDRLTRNSRFAPPTMLPGKGAFVRHSRNVTQSPPGVSRQLFLPSQAPRHGLSTARLHALPTLTSVPSLREATRSISSASKPLNAADTRDETTCIRTPQAELHFKTYGGPVELQGKQSRCVLTETRKSKRGLSQIRRTGRLVHAAGVEVVASFLHATESMLVSLMPNT